MSELVTVRDIQTVTTEIWMIRRQVEQTALSGAIEIGRRLRARQGGARPADEAAAPQGRGRAAADPCGGGGSK